MVIRIVRMVFRPDAVETFLALFDRSAPQIRAFAGCSSLELWQDARYPNILTTCSHWSDAEALEHYRQSELFRNTWTQAKWLFAGPPEAFSHTIVRPADSIFPA